MRVIKGVRPKPRNILLYGEHGAGKNYLAAQFPAAIVIDIEGGSDDIDCERSPRVASYQDFQVHVSWLLTSDHAYRTAVVDSFDWLEKLVQQFVARSRGANSIEEIPYGKGYTFAAEEVERIVSTYRALNASGIATISICHAEARKISPPGETSYERWEPSLEKGVKPILLEFCDEVLFLKKKTFQKKEDLGFNKTNNIVVSTNERILVTSDTGSVVAKNRLSMPDEIPATFDAYASYVMAKRAQVVDQGNIAGIVVDGHSVKEPSNEASKELSETKVF